MSVTSSDEEGPAQRGRVADPAAQDDELVIHSAERDTKRSEFGHVDNPFMHWKTDDVDAFARGFPAECNLGDQTALFQTAATALRVGERWRTIRGLSDADREALADENNGFWQQPKMLKTSTFMFCVGALVQGWCQTVSNVANLQWPWLLGLTSFGPEYCTQTIPDVWKFAFVNASTYLAASFIGCWLSDPMSELFLGRRAPVFASSVLILASTIGSACIPVATQEHPDTWKLLLACRIIMGIGMGCKATVLPVYLAEIAPSHLRGTLMVNWQIFVALGICLGFATNLAVSSIQRNAWRWQTATLCIPTLILLVLVYLCPESPRFLMTRRSENQQTSLRQTWNGHRGLKPWVKNICDAIFWRTTNIRSREELSAAREEEETCRDYKETFKFLSELRGNSLLAAKELMYVHTQMIVETAASRRSERQDAKVLMGSVRSSTTGRDSVATQLLSPTARPLTYLQKIGHLFFIPRIRRATGNALVCMLAQQFCGINVLAFYSSTLYADTLTCEQGERFMSVKPLWLSFGTGAINFLLAIPAYWAIQKPGRRPLLLLTLPFMTVFMLGACLGSLKSHDDPGRTTTLASFTFLFMASYSIGMGPVPFTMSSEVFPREHRMAGMSLSVFANLFGAGILALIVPPLYYSDLGKQGLLAIMTGLNAVAFCFILLFVRETADTTGGRAISLEELTYIFNVRTRTYLRFQRTRMIPWALRYPVRRLRNTFTSFLSGTYKEIPDKPNMKYSRQEFELDDLVEQDHAPNGASSGHSGSRIHQA